jgi:hypothetical protein
VPDFESAEEDTEETVVTFLLDSGDRIFKMQSKQSAILAGQRAVELPPELPGRVILTGLGGHPVALLCQFDMP